MTAKTSNLPTYRRVLAVDPGFDRVGIAVLEDDNLLFSDCVITNRKKSHEKRLLEIGEAVRKVIKKWQPNCLAIEKLFFNQNISTAIKVAEARGVVAYESSRAGLTMFEYGPQTIKVAVTGYGKAAKPQVQNMVERLLKLDKSEKKLDDEVDAIAVGITHLACIRDI